MSRHWTPEERREQAVRMREINRTRTPERQAAINRKRAATWERKHGGKLPKPAPAAPVITSANAVATTVGASFSFTLTASGVPILPRASKAASARYRLPLMPAAAGARLMGSSAAA